MKGLSRPRHCSKGAQPVPKTVYRWHSHGSNNTCRRHIEQFASVYGPDGVNVFMISTSSGPAAETKTKNDVIERRSFSCRGWGCEDAHLCSSSVCLLASYFCAHVRLGRRMSAAAAPSTVRGSQWARTVLSLTHRIDARMNVDAAAHCTCSYSCWCLLDTASLCCVWLLTSALCDRITNFHLHQRIISAAAIVSWPKPCFC